MEEKQSVQKEQQPQVFQFFPQLDPELQTIVLNNLPNDDIALKYLTQCFSNEEGTKKINQGFLQSIIKSLKKHDNPVTVVKTFDPFLQQQRYQQARALLSPLITSIYALNASIPHPTENVTGKKCCSSPFPITDGLDTETIKSDLVTFHKNTIPLWQQFNTDNKNTISFSELINAKKKILGHFKKRLDGYADTTSALSTYGPAAALFGGGLFSTAVGCFMAWNPLAITGLCCMMGSVGTMACSHNECEEDCEHHDMAKVRELSQDIKAVDSSLTALQKTTPRLKY